MTGALAGVRVLELTRGVAGPYAAKLLADQGAEVLKLEPPGGDPSRTFGPFPHDEPHAERSGLFLHLNRHKRAIVVDPASAEGTAMIRALAAEAHLVLEDYAPGSARRMGLGVADVAGLEPGPGADLDHAVRADGAVSRLSWLGADAAGHWRTAVYERTPRPRTPEVGGAFCALSRRDRGSVGLVDGAATG